MIANKISKNSKNSELETDLIRMTTEVRYLHISPRKMRLVVSAIKDLTPKEALRKIAFLDQKGARFLGKGIKTALADAEHNFKLDPDSLAFDRLIVNGGPAIKRRDRHHGARFNGGIIRKQKAHLLIRLVGKKAKS